MLDDSIVRGNTIKVLISLLRSKGANEIHIRISSPPIKHPCKFGVDFAEKELIANDKTEEDINTYIGADSLIYLGVDDITKAMNSNDFCLSCFNEILGNIRLVIE